MATSDAKEMLVGALCKVSSVSSKPENFLSAQPDVASTFKSTTKQLYDFVKRNENKSNYLKGPLAELIISNFDDEQIWQEVELQNDPLLKRLVKDVAKIKRKGDIVSLVPELELLSEEEEVEREKLDEEEVLNEFEETNKRTSDDENDDDDESEGSDLDFDIEAFEAKNEQKRSAVQAKLKTTATKKRKTEVDDKFFSLAEMEEFLVQEDEREERRRDEEEGRMGREESDDDDEESVDMYADDDLDEEEEEGREAMYTDFFDPPNEDSEQKDPASKTTKLTSVCKSVRFEDEMGGEDGEEDGEEAEEEEGDFDLEDVPEEEVQFKRAVKMQSSGPTDLLADTDSEGEDAQDILGGKATTQARSNFQKRQEKLKQTISQLEEANLAEKPWQLTGEVKGGSRPENSLLEEVLTFDQTTAQTPVITEETTMELEDIIKQRIKDKAWDDVERKVKPVEEPFEYKKRVVLDQEKSKASLAEVYEKEYLKQTQDEKKEEENPKHQEIKAMMDSLFVKLDALSNFHFTPKPPAPEVKIISNLPSITHEEVAPISVSDAALLAPEEVKEKSKAAGQEKGALEKTTTDRKRERRQKKIQKRKKLEAREKKHKLVEKLNPGLGNKYAKKRALEELELQSKHGGRTKIIKDDGKFQPLKSSKAFFTQLQEEVSQEVKKARGSKNSKKKKKDTSASKLKL